MMGKSSLASPKEIAFPDDFLELQEQSKSIYDMWISAGVDPEENALIEVSIISKDGTVVPIDYDWETVYFTGTELGLQFEFDDPL